MIIQTTCPKCGSHVTRESPDDCPPEIAQAISRIIKCQTCVAKLSRNSDGMQRRRLDKREARATAPDP